jgi:cell division transport system ATP-binding protein
MILFENVTKEYPNGTVALQEVSFHVEPQEFLFITGPSGSGKTTVLRLMLSELQPSSGSIKINGEELISVKKKKLPELRRKIGAIFQDYKLIEDRTVFENVSLISEILKQGKEEIDEHVQEILGLVGLGEKSDLFPSQLSGGELQRTAIARALATQPQIIFADEPTGNLDEATSWEIINLLKKLNKAGTTVIIATHNQAIINSLDKRNIELKEGRVVRDTKKPKKDVKKKKKNEKQDEKGKKLAQKKADINNKKEEAKNTGIEKRTEKKQEAGSNSQIEEEKS